MTSILGTNYHFQMKSKIIALLLSLVFCLTAVIPVIAQDQNQVPVYVVQPGDTLNTIAARFGISTDELINFNNITNPDFVGAGTRLSIPGLQGITGTLSTNVVKLGESLNSLVVKYKINAGLLSRLNDITSPGEINAGSVLLLPYSEETDLLVPVAKIDSSKTLLEIAAENNTTTWNLLDQNIRSTETLFFFSDIVYLKSDDSSRPISPVDPKLNNVSISPLPLVQGETFEITVDSPQAVTLEGSLNGLPLHFFALEENKHVALQGIDAMAEPGLSAFTLSGTFADGSKFAIEQSVLLMSGNYPTADPLIVDPSLIDPIVTGPEDELMKSETLAATSEKYWSGIFTRPGFYDDYTAYYGERRTYNDGAYSSFHAGVDFGGGEGSQIAAAADGVVVYTGFLKVRGNTTIIDHGWGVYTAYFHQSEIDVVEGDKVAAGQIIGKVGNTGRVNDANAFSGAGAHLHWEVWVNGIQVDPIQWLDNEYP